MNVMIISCVLSMMMTVRDDRDDHFVRFEHDDDDLANFFRVINENAYQALKYLERHPDRKEHWTQRHYKNYHMN